MALILVFIHLDEYICMSQSTDTAVYALVSATPNLHNDHVEEQSASILSKEIG